MIWSSDCANQERDTLFGSTNVIVFLACEGPFRDGQVETELPPNAPVPLAGPRQVDSNGHHVHIPRASATNLIKTTTTQEIIVFAPFCPITVTTIVLLQPPSIRPQSLPPKWVVCPSLLTLCDDGDIPCDATLTNPPMKPSTDSPPSVASSPAPSWARLSSWRRTPTTYVSNVLA